MRTYSAEETMMWILVSNILLIFAIGAIYANSGDIDVISCNEELDNQMLLIDSCTNQIFNSTAFNNELDLTLLQYAGDNDAVHTFANAYCPVLNEVIQCRFVGNVSAECRYPYEVEKIQRRFSLFTAVLNYACANNAAVLISVLESNGLATVYDNSNFFECLGFLLTASRIDETNAELTFEICNGIDKSFECYTDLVRDHKNQHLVAIANELRSVFHRTVKCPIANE